MTAWRTPIVRQAENTSDSGKDHSTGSQPESAAPIRDPPAADRSAKPRLFLPSAIKQLFHEVKKALTFNAKNPVQRRRRTEDTRSGFRAAAVRLVRSIFHPREGEPERPWLSDTLEWLQLWTEEPATGPDLDHDPMRPGSFDPSGDFSPDP